jgi:hypothetical protein
MQKKFKKGMKSVLARQYSMVVWAMAVLLWVVTDGD